MDQHHVEYITEKASAVTTQEIEQEPGSVYGVPLVIFKNFYFLLLLPRVVLYPKHSGY